MSMARAVTIVVGLAALVSATRARGECSPSGLDAVRVEIAAAAAPDCGPRTYRRAFAHACDRAATLTERAIVQCAAARPARVTRAHHMLFALLGRMARPAVVARLGPDCAAVYRTALERLDDDLLAAANGETTTTTTSPPGTPTTTTEPGCTTVMLDVDKGDCSAVRSEPRGLVDCGAACSESVFSVPAAGTLRLTGTPGPGDTGVSFGGDCEDDGTVDLGDASPPDCSLSCDCSSE